MIDFKNLENKLEQEVKKNMDLPMLVTYLASKKIIDIEEFAEFKKQNYNTLKEIMMKQCKEELEKIQKEQTNESNND